ncbi:MAG: lipid-binding SYLF domain-containing protein [Alphaproteobacteria bacterium]|nr:lipid-binding SYLF domain-containing protein [Alphaproteobacteria bacterium]
MRFLPFYVFLLFALISAPAYAVSGMSREETQPSPPVKAPDDITDQKELLVKAQATVESMLSNPDYPSLLNLATRAKAILIVPRMIKLSFLIGGHGGSGVLLARGPDNKWSNPAFYTIGGINYGFQLGGQSSELILTVMSEKGLRALLDHELTLGADAGASIGTIGRGAHAATGLGQDADVYAFARSEGLYVGISLDGTVITPDNGWNEAFYGKGAVPEAILVERKFTSPNADKLLAAMP